MENIDPADGRSFNYMDLSNESSRKLYDYKQLAVEAETIFNNSHDGLWIQDGEGKVLAMNRAAERLNHLRASDCIGKNIKEIISQNFIDPSVTLEAANSGTKVSRIQTNKLGHKLMVTAIPIFDENGQLVRVVSNERDMTEIDDLRRKLEEQEAIKNKYQHHLKELQIDELKNSEIIAESPNIINLFRQAAKLSEVDSTVLITGESGVGKGVMAKFIHKNSSRGCQPIIEINCSAIPEPLLESELFGYEKGAFTGADSKGKPGYFELADGGILFLDEIGDLPPASQAKLLRFIEDGHIIRVGGTKRIKLDIRIIAATNRNLEKMLKEKKFRLDLYHRLNVVPLHIPPLRERRDCILPLVRHFMEFFKTKMKLKRNASLTQRAFDALQVYEYPGNVRELMNICERLLVMSNRPWIDVRDLPTCILLNEKKIETNDKTEPWMTLSELLENEEKRIMSKAMQAFGTQSKAAEVLGVSQPTIARKLKKHGIFSKY